MGKQKEDIIIADIRTVVDEGETYHVPTFNTTGTTYDRDKIAHLINTKYDVSLDCIGLKFSRETKVGAIEFKNGEIVEDSIEITDDIKNVCSRN